MITPFRLETLRVMAAFDRAMAATEFRDHTALLAASPPSPMTTLLVPPTVSPPEPPPAPPAPVLAVVPLPARPPPRPRRSAVPREYRLVCLRDCPNPDTLSHGNTAESIAAYHHEFIAKGATFRPEVENVVVIFLSTRLHIIGHTHVSHGTLDTCMVHAREVFRPAIVANASAVALLHNHPSGDPMPSEQDIRFTRELIRAGEQLRIKVLDHVIIGHSGPGKGWCSLLELGYLFK